MSLKFNLPLLGRKSISKAGIIDLRNSFFKYTSHGARMEMKDWIGKGHNGKLLLCCRNVKQLVSRILYGQYPNLFDI